MTEEEEIIVESEENQDDAIVEGETDDTDDSDTEADGESVDAGAVVPVADDAKSKKTKKQRLKDAVLLWKLDTDDNGDYTLDGEHIERADLPREAVHVVGTKGMFGGGNKQFLMLGDGVDPPAPVHVQEDGMFALTATDLYLFCVNNDIRDEFNIKQTAKFGTLDTRKIMIWLAVAVVAVCVIYAMI